MTFHPDRTGNLTDQFGMILEKSISILPAPGADEDCDEADARVSEIDGTLNSILQDLKKQYK